MKIGYLLEAGSSDIINNNTDGPSIHVRQVFKELQNLGHEVCLLVYLDGHLWKSTDFIEFNTISGTLLDQGPLRLVEKVFRRIQFELHLPYIALFNSFRFASAARRELDEFDLLYERMSWMGYGGSLASRILGIPLIFEVNGDDLSELELLGIAPRGVQRLLSIIFMRKAIYQASHIVASGEGWRQRFIERWNADPDYVTTVQNGSELVNLLEREQLQSFCSQVNSAEATKIVYLGGFQPWQGLTILLHAIARIVFQGIQIKLTLIGAGPDREQLEQLAYDLHIRELITFAGKMTQLQYAPYLANADIGVAPYCGWSEFSGLKLLDYKAAGLAIIVSGKNGEPSTIVHRKTGWIVPPCDEDALCKAITQLSADVELRKFLGREARIEAEKYHSWEHTAQQLEQLFFQALNQ